MDKYYILYNPLSANNKGKEGAEKLKDKLKNKELIFKDITEIKDYKTFIGKVENANLVICGGDGTINKFVNNINGITVENEIYYYATGTGNDFLRDIKEKEECQNDLYPLNKYITNLPTVVVNGKTYKFINGIGYGIDGYCCEVGDKLRENSSKKINYTSIAIKGLLFHYKPTNAKVCVDGKEYNFKKVWIAPTMNGKFYGGGMMAAPTQERLNENSELSLVLMYGHGRIKTLSIFPSIFKGEHIKHENSVKILKGKNISVEFDRPVALQIDGETILNVTKYNAYSKELDSSNKNIKEGII